MRPSDAGAIADVAAVFEAGLSGYGRSPYLSCEQLLELSALCLAADRIIHMVEAYAIAPDADYSTPEFSLYGQHPDELTRSWQARASDSHALIIRLVADARASGEQVMFQVWLDWQDAASG